MQANSPPRPVGARVFHAEDLPALLKEPSFTVREIEGAKQATGARTFQCHIGKDTAVKVSREAARPLNERSKKAVNFEVESLPHVTEVIVHAPSSQIVNVEVRRDGVYALVKVNHQVREAILEFSNRIITHLEEDVSIVDGHVFVSPFLEKTNGASILLAKLSVFGQRISRLRVGSTHQPRVYKQGDSIQDLVKCVPVGCCDITLFLMGLFVDDFRFGPIIYLNTADFDIKSPNWSPHPLIYTPELAGDFKDRTSQVRSSSSKDQMTQTSDQMLTNSCSDAEDESYIEKFDSEGCTPPRSSSVNPNVAQANLKLPPCIVDGSVHFGNKLKPNQCSDGQDKIKIKTLKVSRALFPGTPTFEEFENLSK